MTNVNTFLLNHISQCFISCLCISAFYEFNFSQQCVCVCFPQLFAIYSRLRDVFRVCTTIFRALVTECVVLTDSGTQLRVIVLVVSRHYRNNKRGNPGSMLYYTSTLRHYALCYIRCKNNVFVASSYRFLFKFCGYVSGIFFLSFIFILQVKRNICYKLLLLFQYCIRKLQAKTCFSIEYRK